MDGYRALCSTHGAATISRSSLNLHEITRLCNQPMAATRVFVLKQNDLDQLDIVSNGLMLNRGSKLPAKPLAYYFDGKTGLVRISANYHNPGQAERGIRSLLASTHIHFRGAAFFIGISEEIFEQLWQRAPESSKAGSLHPHGVNTNTSDDFRGFVDQHPGWEAPDSIRNAYMGGSPAAEQVRRLIMLAARVDHSVLVEGKTGTGKEVVARQIHELSQRRVQRFVTVNCGGIPADLLESELFGHKKGAFTGALTDKDGLWTIASTGTLFLDEIGDLSRQHQVKILRALEDGKYRSVGGTEEIKSKARIVAATNRDLAKMVAAGQFREDLYYRLFTFRIRTPALRDHPDDIPEMAAHFWQEIARNECGRLPENVMDALKGYRWPGNARELRAFLINVFMLADSRPVTLPLIHAVMHERIGPIPHPNQEP